MHCFFDCIIPWRWRGCFFSVADVACIQLNSFFIFWSVCLFNVPVFSMLLWVLARLVIYEWLVLAACYQSRVLSCTCASSMPQPNTSSTGLFCASNGCQFGLCLRYTCILLFIRWRLHAISARSAIPTAQSPDIISASHTHTPGFIAPCVFYLILHGCVFLVMRLCGAYQVQTPFDSRVVVLLSLYMLTAIQVCCPYQVFFLYPAL